MSGCGGMQELFPRSRDLGDIPCTFFNLEHSHVFLGIAQQSVFIKHIRDSDITEEKGFPSGKGGFGDLALAVCCERLLPNANLREFELQCFEKSRCDTKKIGRGYLYF